MTHKCGHPRRCPQQPSVDAELPTRVTGKFDSVEAPTIRRHPSERQGPGGTSHYHAMPKRTMKRIVKDKARLSWITLQRA